MRNMTRSAVITVLATIFCAHQALAAPVVLPPINPAYAQVFQDFVSYSAKLLTAFGFAGFDGPVGVGGLDLIVAAHASGQDNSPVSGGFNFPDPMATPSGNGVGSDVFDDSWGRTGTFTPIPVSTLLNYLHTNFGPTVNVPIFNFDMSQNQTGTDANLLAGGRVQILDTNNGNSVVKEWILQNAPVGTPFDPSNPGAFDILVPGEITATYNGNTQTVHNNIGSGKNDFINYAPTMNLALYNQPGYIFVADFHMSALNGGGEEVFLTGSIAPNAVPEPATMLLMGMGAAGAAFMRRRKARASA